MRVLITSLIGVMGDLPNLTSNYSNKMATGQREIREKVTELRKMNSDPNEPIHSEERTVKEENSALYANITARARDLLNVDAGDEVKIHSYRGFLVVEPIENGSEQDE